MKPGEGSITLAELDTIIDAVRAIADETHMSTTKFRAWYHGKMIVKSLNDILADSSNNFMFLDGEVTQFTGLLDKNGKEICEGDIIKWSIFPESGETKSVIDVVEYAHGVCAVKARNEIIGLMPPYREIEIIGNIYENKEE